MFIFVQARHKQTHRDTQLQGLNVDILCDSPIPR